MQPIFDTVNPIDLAIALSGSKPNSLTIVDQNLGILHYVLRQLVSVLKNYQLPKLRLLFEKPDFERRCSQIATQKISKTKIRRHDSPNLSHSLSRLHTIANNPPAKNSNSSKRVTWTYGLAGYSHPLRWRSPINKSETQFFTLILPTHNLLKNLRREIRGFSNRYFAQKSASPAGSSWGCEGTKNPSCGGARPPPGGTKSLATISFINPLRFASIADATAGLIQLQPFLVG